MTAQEILKKEIEAFIKTQSGNIAVSFYDLNEKSGFSIDGEKKMLSASTIKLVIMAELMRRIHLGDLSLENKIKVTAQMKTGGDGILKALEPGHSFTLKELLTLMIIISDNEATNILIDFLSMASINQMAQTMHLKQAHLGRKMMDSKAQKAGSDNYICAEDIKDIFKSIYEGTCIDKESSKMMLDILKQQQQSNRLQLYLPEELEIAHKCGDLDCLENDGGIFLLPKHPYILVVLTNEMPTNKDGREAIGKISWIVYQAIC
ncbi:serine hydrolase [Caproicibacterium sp. BJN0003]|uniref:serine hydrolase n=1 Tax=Caproicibacterium sp. BJN0003 TaxID=2994078 RepID=UPI0022547235|nr:serine hydrolase [Caproicibacterium sp. BJN0003]UZT81899.1 class A beta-lactamase-related serine hydrolase [Caproicibacterium sp. BJN0003]